MRAADQQQWYPRWGLALDTALVNLIGVGAPATQLHNIFGSGWNPPFDRAAQHLAGPPLTSADAQCRAIMQQGGWPNSFDTYLDFVQYCEGLFFLKASV